MLDPNSNLGDGSVVFLVFDSQLLPAWFLLGLNDGDALNSEPLKTSILEQPTSIRQLVSCFISRFLVILLTLTSLAQKEDPTGRIGYQDILDCVSFFLPL